MGKKRRTIARPGKFGRKFNNQPYARTQGDTTPVVEAAVPAIEAPAPAPVVEPVVVAPKPVAAPKPTRKARVATSKVATRKATRKKASKKEE